MGAGAARAGRGPRLLVAGPSLEFVGAVLDPDVLEPLAGADVGPLVQAGVLVGAAEFLQVVDVRRTVGVLDADLARIRGDDRAGMPGDDHLP